MASDLSWGGLPFMLPSPVCYKYLHSSTQVIPERMIRIGARYRARRNLVEHVRGYRLIKKSLQRKLAEIESDRKNAHYQLPAMDGVIHSVFSTASHVDVYPKPPNSVSFCPTYTSRHPLFRKKIQIGNTEPRSEWVLDMVDVRKRMEKNPSEKMVNKE